MLASGKTSFGVRWEFYCIERDAWWRIVHGVSLALPPIVTLVLCIMIADVLGSCSGDPSPRVRVKALEWMQLVFLIVCSLAAIAYLVAEQIIGWSAGWKPRIAEAAITPVVLSAFIIDPNVWRAYSFWFRGRLPPPRDDITDLFEPARGLDRRLASPYAWLAKRDEKRSRSIHSSRSSFYAPARGPSWSPNGRKLSRSRSRREVGTRSRPKRPRDQVERNASTRNGARSPPFTYSVARSDTSPTLPEREEVDLKQFLAPPSPSYNIPPKPLQKPSPAATRQPDAINAIQWMSPPSPSHYIPRNAVLDPSPTAERPFQFTDADMSLAVVQWVTPPSPSYYLPRPASPRVFNGLSRPADLRKQLAANLNNTQTQYTDGSFLLDNPFSPKPSESSLVYLSDQTRPQALDVATNVSGPSRYLKQSLYDPFRSDVGR